MAILAHEELVRGTRVSRLDSGGTTTSDATPFRIEVPEPAIDDLTGRLARTRWPVSSPGEGWTRGVPTDYLRELCRYWQREYDWRVHEARFNEHSQYTTSIDGQTIHFMVVRSRGAESRDRSCSFTVGPARSSSSRT